MLQQLIHYRDNKKWEDSIKLVENSNFLNESFVDVDNVKKVIDEYYISSYYMGDLDKCLKIMKYYNKIGINRHIMSNTDFLLSR